MIIVGSIVVACFLALLLCWCAATAYNTCREEWVSGSFILFLYVGYWICASSFGWIQKIVLGKLGSVVASFLLAVWIGCELVGFKDKLASLIAAAGPAAATIATVVLWCHLAKLYVDHVAYDHLRKSRSKSDSVAHHLSNLTDFFLEKVPSKTSGYDRTAVVRKAGAMLSLLTGVSTLYVVAFRLKKEEDNRVAHHVEALNDEAHELNTEGGRVEAMANQLSRAKGDSKRENIFAYAMIDEEPGNLGQARFRYGCRVLEDLNVERFLPSGRPIPSIPKGSCVGYTIGLHDGSHGYLVLAFSDSKYSFRSRDRHLYALPLRACAMLLMGLDRQIPKVLPSTRRKS